MYFKTFDLKEEGTWDDRRRDGGTNSTLRIKEKKKRLILNEHDDDDDEVQIRKVLLKCVVRQESNRYQSNTVNLFRH